MDQFHETEVGAVGAGLEDERVDELVGVGLAPLEHLGEQVEGGGVRGEGVGGEESGVEEDVGGAEGVEDEAGVGEVGEIEGGEADHLEGEELVSAMAGGDHVGLDLLEIGFGFGSFEEGDNALVESWRS